jgi:hypothetical protein
VVTDEGGAFASDRLFKGAAVLIPQTHIILGKRRDRGLRSENIVELGELQLLTERIFGNPVQCRGHPPRKTLRLPHPRQRALRIMIDAGKLGMKTGEGLRKWAPGEADAVRERLSRFLVEQAKARKKNSAQSS